MASRKVRSGLQKIHLWFGFALAIPFILIGLSGSLIVLLSSLDDLSLPSAEAKGETQPLARVLEAAERTAAPGWTVQTLILPQKPGDPVSVQLNPPRGRRFGANRIVQASILYFDPVSLKLLGSATRGRAGAFMRELVTLHVALLIPDYFGVRLVGFMGIAMVLFGLSGLVLWWPKRGRSRSAFLIEDRLYGYRLNRDLHSVIGFWTLPVFLIMSISGVDLAFPVTFQSAFGSFFPLTSNFTTAPGGTTSGRATSSSPDTAVRLALNAVPEADVVSVQLSPRSSDSYMLTLRPRAYGPGAPDISVFVGPGTQVSDVVDPRSFSFGKRILLWLRVLHYGQGLGVIWQALVFLSGFLPLFFAVTGFAMWWLKRSQKRAVIIPPPQLAAAE